MSSAAGASGTGECGDTALIKLIKSYKLIKVLEIIIFSNNMRMFDPCSGGNISGSNEGQFLVVASLNFPFKLFL